MIPAIKRDFTVKVAVMYIISKFGEPIEDEILTDIATGVCEINYFVLKQCEFELADNEFVQSYNSDGTEFYTLTEKGIQALDFFTTKLLYSTRLKINDYIKNYTPNKHNNKFLCDIVPVSDLDFNVCVEYKENSQTMLKLEFYAGDRAQATALVRKIRGSRDVIYSDIYKYIMRLAAKQDKNDIDSTPKYEEYDDNMTFFE